MDNPSLGEPLRQIATYLINIKRLVQDHNIDSDEFAKIKTKGKVTLQSIAPSPFYTPETSQDRTLVFESRFESGNLLVAI